MLGLATVHAHLEGSMNCMDTLGIQEESYV